MEKTRFVFGVLFVLLIILASEEMVMQSEGRKHSCEVLSETFKGLCFSDTNCASACRSEGHVSGDCRGARRRCFCSGNC